MLASMPSALHPIAPCMPVSVHAPGVVTWRTGEEIDASDVMQRAWPRAAAFAERMWSQRARAHSVEEAAPRIARFACRLKARGIPAQAISPGSCFATS